MDPMQSGVKALTIDNQRVGPATPRFGKLRNGNPSGDPSTSPRCGAKTRSGAPCRAPAMWSDKAGAYTRCRMHGGASTGPKTPGGLEKCRRANRKHGRFSAEYLARSRESRREIRWLTVLTERMLRAEAKRAGGRHVVSPLDMTTAELRQVVEKARARAMRAEDEQRGPADRFRDSRHLTPA
jgi:hypothetical protein